MQRRRRSRAIKSSQVNPLGPSYGSQTSDPCVHILAQPKQVSSTRFSFRSTSFSHVVRSKVVTDWIIYLVYILLQLSMPALLLKLQTNGTHKHILPLARFRTLPSFHAYFLPFPRIDLETITALFAESRNYSAYCMIAFIWSSNTAKLKYNVRGQGHS